jgi:hypothetical protein
VNCADWKLPTAVYIYLDISYKCLNVQHQLFIQVTLNLDGQSL